MKFWRSKPKFDHWKPTFSEVENARIWWGFGVGFAAIGLFYQTVGSPKPPFTGKGSLLSSLFYEIVGPKGYPAAMYAIAGLLIAVGFSIWVVEKTHSSGKGVR